MWEVSNWQRDQGMAYQAETKNVVLFCNFGNIALGVRDADLG
jgi:hypothetical protein